MQRYKHIYIDLDRTLWDFEANSTEALSDLFKIYRLENVFPSFEAFHNGFDKHNREMWDRYLKGEMKKEVLRILRFHLTLNEYGVSDNILAGRLCEDYIRISPTKTILIPHTHHALEYLKQKYSLHIITNGFNEVQFTKLRNSGIDKYFQRVITSENAGYMKPRIEIFNYSLASANARKKECIMIGDDLETDIRGARNAGIDQVYFNPRMAEHHESPNYEINSLKELTEIF